MTKVEAKHYGRAIVDEAWLDQVREPELPIIDPHHHLWRDRPSGRYMPEELAADLGSGHVVQATVFVQGGVHPLLWCSQTVPLGLAGAAASSGGEDAAAQQVVAGSPAHSSL